MLIFFVMGYRFGKEERERLAAVERYLAENLHETVRVEGLCRLAIMGRDKLNAGFERFYGCTVRAYLTRLRMQKARELLRQTEESVGAIAAACGYEHAENFTKSYKRVFGVTPRMERKEAEG